MTKNQPPLSKLTEKQILRLVNDAVSGLSTGSTSDWRAVAFHFRARSVEARSRLQELKAFASDLKLARRIYSEASDRIADWLSADSSQ